MLQLVQIHILGDDVVLLKDKSRVLLHKLLKLLGVLLVEITHHLLEFYWVRWQFLTWFLLVLEVLGIQKFLHHELRVWIHVLYSR